MTSVDPKMPKVLAPWRLWRLRVRVARTIQSNPPLAPTAAPEGASGSSTYLAHFRTTRPFPWPIAPTAGGSAGVAASAAPLAGVGLASYVAATSPSAALGSGGWMAADDVAIELQRPELRTLLRSTRADLDLQIVDGLGAIVDDPACSSWLAWQEPDAPAGATKPSVPPTLRLLSSGTLPLSAALLARALPSLLVERFDPVLTSWPSPPSPGIAGWEDVTGQVAPLANGTAQWVRTQATLPGDGAGWRVDQLQPSGGGSSAPWAPDKPGPTLVFHGYASDSDTEGCNPALWEDYRASVQLLAQTANPLGLVVRYTNEGVQKPSYYRVALSPADGTCQLHRVEGSNADLLAGCQLPVAEKRRIQLVVEAVGGHLRVWVDGALLLGASDPTPLKAGTVGLWCWHNAGARFADVVVRDLRRQPPHRFDFAVRTSKFRSVGHMLAAAQVPAGVAKLSQATLTAAEASAVANPSQPTEPVDAEVRGFTAVLAASQSVLPSLQSPSERVRLTWLCDTTGVRKGLLAQFPQPVAWPGVLLTMTSAQPPPEPATSPVTAALRLGGKQGEFVECWALRDGMLASASVHTLDDGDPLMADPPRPPLFDGTRTTSSTTCYSPPFVPGALRAFTFAAGASKPLESTWSVVAKGLASGPWVVRSAKSGASAQMALLTAAPGADVDVTVEFAADESTSAGIVLRWRDVKNHIRCVRSAAGTALTIVRREEGDDKTVASIPIIVAAGPVTLRLVCHGMKATVWFNNILLTTLDSVSSFGGQVGLFAAGSGVVDFSSLRVQSRQVAPFVRKLAPWSVDDVGSVVDDQGKANGWSTNATAADGELAVRLAGDVSGLCTFGVRADYMGNGYLLDVEKIAGTLQLTLKRCTNGASVPVAGPLAVQTAASPNGHQLQLSAVGQTVLASVDGKTEMSWWEPGQGPQGGRGYFAGALTSFSAWAMIPADRRVGPFQVSDDDPNSPISTWQWQSGTLARLKDIGAAKVPLQLCGPGSVALFGDVSWSDLDLTATMRSSDVEIGIELRRQDARNGYRLVVSPASAQIALLLQTNGKLLPLKTAWTPGLFTSGNSTEVIRVVCTGARIRCWRGTSQLFDVTDNTFMSGDTGFYVGTGGAAQFFHISVRPPRSDIVAASAWSTAPPEPTGWQFLTLNAAQAVPWDCSTHGMAKPDTTAARALAVTPLGPDVAVAVNADAIACSSFGLTVRANAAGSGLNFILEMAEGGTALLSLSWAGVVDGIWASKLLWSRATAAPTGTVVRRLALTAVGDRVRGWADGSPAFDLILPSECAPLADGPGQVGLRAGAGTVSFSAFKSMPAWQLSTSARTDEDMTAWTPSRWRVLDSTGATVADPLTAGWLVQDKGLSRTVKSASFGYIASASATTGNARISAVVDLPDIGCSIGVFSRQSADGKQVCFGITGVGVGAWKWDVTTRNAWTGADAKVSTGALSFAAPGLANTALVALDVADGQVTAHADGTVVWRGSVSVGKIGRTGIFAAGAGSVTCRRIVVQEIGWRTLAVSDSPTPLATGQRMVVPIARPLPGQWRKYRVCGANLAVLDERWLMPAESWSPIATSVLRARDGSGVAIFGAGLDSMVARLEVLRLRGAKASMANGGTFLTVDGSSEDDLGDVTGA